MRGFTAVFRKEFAHVRRERSTLFFAFVIPVLQLAIFGYAIDMKVEHIRTAVLNLDGREESRLFVESLVNSRVFRVIEHATNDEELRRAVTSGRAAVAVIVAPDFSERRLRGDAASVQVLIDGSNSQVATTALNSVNLIGVRRSLELARQRDEATQSAAARDALGRSTLAFDVRPRLLYNPDLESAVFFVPALVGIILQNVTIFLTSFAIVRERELGTLEQLFVTPVSRTGLLAGKLAPYTIIGFLTTLIVLLAMVFGFGVPIHGSLVLLLALSLLFLIAALGLGLLISTFAKTQLQAIQNAFLILLPSILLSGFVFPRESMPFLMYALGNVIPVTYFLEILRGIILRGADFRDLLPHILGLTLCCVAILLVSLTRFRKQLD